MHDAAALDDDRLIGEPQRHLGIAFWGGSFSPGLSIKADYRLLDLGGRTRLDYVAELVHDKGLPLWMRLLMPLFKFFGTRQLKRFMDTLQQLAEGAD